MVRRAVFALLLIGAAFAGGAAINGPGLAWLRRNFAGGPSIIVDPADPGRPDPSGNPPPKQFPTAKVPSLLGYLPPAAPPRKPDPAPDPAAIGLESARVDAPLLPESPSTPAAALAPLPTTAAPLEDDPPIPPLPSDPKPRPKSDPVARLASVEQRAQEPPPAPSWADLRRRMKALGVARYTIEAETDGRVRFRCVIPVDGLKAVGHHFEAEGDDEHQAADAALRRIALWKATAPQD